MPTLLDRDNAVLGELAAAAPARLADAGDAVAGVASRFVASPRSTEEVAAVMQVADRHGLTVVARGAGSKLAWGLPPESADLVVSLESLTGLVDHAAGDLVVTVRAGTRTADLQRAVATADQQLALDEVVPGATVGGTVAANTSGPRRLRYGTVRDLLLGVTFVRADGVVARAGGRVVKNVAGYDFGKLLTGSFGTLGIITEVVFRLHPAPAARAFVTATVADADAVGRCTSAVRRSQSVPSAVELQLNPDGGVSVTVLLEGVAAGMAARVHRVAEVFGGAAAVGDQAPDAFSALPFTPGDTGIKVTSSLTGVPAIVAVARQLARAGSAPLALRGSAAGVFHVGVPADTVPGEVAVVVGELREVAARFDGTVTVLTAPPAVRERVDVWGPIPGIALMRRLKSEMDPRRRLAPGRFVGGI